IANAVSDYTLEITVNPNQEVISDMDLASTYNELRFKRYTYKGKNRLDFTLFINSSKQFYSYRNEVVEVVNGIRNNKLNEIQQALIIDKVTKYVAQNIGAYPFKKITVSQTDYD